MSAPSIPPAARSRAAAGLSVAAARGRFELQCCENCGALQYPPREACRVCLEGPLVWQPQSGEGALISDTLIHRSNSEFFQARAPWRIGIVRLDCELSVITHVHSACGPAPSRVRVDVFADSSGNGVLFALPPGADPDLTSDPRLSGLLR